MEAYPDGDAYKQARWVLPSQLVARDTYRCPALQDYDPIVPENKTSQRQLRTYGIREFAEDKSIFGLQSEELAIQGFTVIPAILGTIDLLRVRDLIDSTYEIQRKEIDETELARIGEADIVRCPLSYDDAFLEIAANTQILALVRQILGTNVVLMTQNAIINRPHDQNFQAAWHRDLNYQHFTSSRPLAISALYCIDDFSVETGGTHILPGSHKIESFPTVQYAERHALSLTADAGSVLVFDSMIFHRTGDNRSDGTRRAVNHVYTLPIIQQQISLPDALGERTFLDPDLRTLFGYTFQPPKSSDDWRRQKLGRD